MWRNERTPVQYISNDQFMLLPYLIGNFQKSGVLDIFDKIHPYFTSDSITKEEIESKRLYRDVIKSRYGMRCEWCPDIKKRNVVDTIYDLILQDVMHYNPMDIARMVLVPRQYVCKYKKFIVPETNVQTPTHGNYILNDDVLTIVFQFVLSKPNDWARIGQVSKQFTRVRNMHASSLYMPIPQSIKRMPFLCPFLIPNLQYHDMLDDLKCSGRLNMKIIYSIERYMKPEPIPDFILRIYYPSRYPPPEPEVAPVKKPITKYSWLEDM